MKEYIYNSIKSTMVIFTLISGKEATASLTNCFNQTIQCAFGNNSFTNLCAAPNVGNFSNNIVLDRCSDMLIANNGKYMMDWNINKKNPITSNSTIYLGTLANKSGSNNVKGLINTGNYYPASKYNVKFCEDAVQGVGNENGNGIKGDVVSCPSDDPETVFKKYEYRDKDGRSWYRDVFGDSISKYEASSEPVTDNMRKGIALLNNPFDGAVVDMSASECQKSIDKLYQYFVEMWKKWDKIDYDARYCDEKYTPYEDQDHDIVNEAKFYRQWSLNAREQLLTFPKDAKAANGESSKLGGKAQNHPDRDIRGYKSEVCDSQPSGVFCSVLQWMQDMLSNGVVNVCSVVGMIALLKTAKGIAKRESGEGSRDSIDVKTFDVLVDDVA